MSGFTDYHAHFVYGVDDGARTREEMFAMLDAAAADGVTRLLPPLTARRAWSPFRGTCISGILILHGLTAPKRAMTSRWKAAPELLYTPAAAYAAAGTA